MKKSLYWVATVGGEGKRNIVGRVHRLSGRVAALRMAKKLAKSTCRAVEIVGEGGKYQKMVTPPRKCGRGNTGRIVDN